MRNGYPAPWTFGEQLESGWFGHPGEPSFEHWKRVCAIELDGIPLREVRPLRRGPAVHEKRYAQKFNEVMIAAVALARLAAEHIRIDTGGDTPRERPDLLVSIGNAELGVEIVEVQPGGYAAGAADDLHAALNQIFEDEPALRPSHTYLHISRSPGRSTSRPMHKTTRARLMAIVRGMLRTRAYEKWATSGAHPVLDWEGASLGYTLYVARAAFAPLGYIQFDDSACSFEPLALVDPAIAALEMKRARADKYDQRRPLWLIAGLTERAGLYSDSLRILASRELSITPFERVIMHDGNIFVSYGSGDVDPGKTPPITRYDSLRPSTG